MELNETLRWLLGRAAIVLIGALVLSLIYRLGVTAIHRIIPTVIAAQATHLPSGSSTEDEVAKRIRTIEDLMLKVLRVGVLAGLVVLTLAAFELYAILAAIVLVIVAIVFATRDVVLDYVMGFLIWSKGRTSMRLRGGRWPPGRRRGRRGDRPSPHAPARWIGLVTRRVERLHPRLDQPHPPVLGRRRRPARPPRRGAGPGIGDRGEGRRGAARGPGVVRAAGHRHPGRHRDDRHRHGRRDRPNAAARVAGAQLAVASELRRRLAGAFAEASIATGRWDMDPSMLQAMSGSAAS